MNFWLSFLQKLVAVFSTRFRYDLFTSVETTLLQGAEGALTMFLPEMDASMILLLVTVTVAGAVRGFAGFGTGMIIAPVAAALYGPVAALVIIFILDSLPAIPVTIPALKIANWSEVIPVVLGAALFMPAGVWLLKTGDPTVLRWVICGIILVAVAILASGWRYTGPRNRLLSFGVGGVGGVMGGIANIPGPPPILYWMASPAPAQIVRANLLVFLLLNEIFLGINLWASMLFTWDAVMRGLVAAPFYFAGTMIGLVLFRFASEATYRVIAFVIIAGVTVAALPALDGLYSG